MVAAAKQTSSRSVVKQNKIAFHHMLANSLADVVAEEAAKRLLPDLNLEQKAKRAERVGVSVAKRLALVQADTWAKHEELMCLACNIYRARRQFWSKTLCVPRPDSKDDIARFRARKSSTALPSIHTLPLTFLHIVPL